MRQPRPVGSAINSSRRRSWHSHFAHYKYPPTQNDIDDFLGQFGASDQDLAARLLDAVQVVSQPNIEIAFQELMAIVPGWHRAKSKRKGKWRFVPYSFSSGESGDQMVASFRQAMGMKERYYNELFIHPRNLVDEKLRGRDTVVLVDDFAGSGNQARQSWDRLFRELVGGVGTVYLLVVAATLDAQIEIRNNTDLQVLSHYNLDGTDNLFAAECHHFTAAEKNAILAHCTTHFPDAPRGYGDCGLLFVLHHDCPNNSIPLLHKHKANHWVPLFPRSNRSN